MPPSLSDIFKLADKAVRNANLAMLDAMDHVANQSGRTFAHNNAWRFLDRTKYDWRFGDYGAFPWGVISWVESAPGGVEVVLGLRMFSRVFPIEPMIIAAVSASPASGDKWSSWHLEAHLRNLAATVSPLIGADERLVQVTSKRKNVTDKWHAFAVSLDRLDGPESLDTLLVTPLVHLLAGDLQTTLAALPGDDPARVRLVTGGSGEGGDTGEEAP